MSGHTPGPWLLFSSGDGGMHAVHPATWCGLDNQEGQRALIANVSPWSGEPKFIPEAEANARLISTAPELLAALRNLVHGHTLHDAGDDATDEAYAVMFTEAALDAAREVIAKATGEPE